MTEEKKFTLNSKQSKYLKGLGHHLKPLVQVGKGDITQPVIDAIKKELERHELIKVKLGQNTGVKKDEAPEIITSQVDCTVVQLIGKTILLYKQNIKLPKDTRINLPK